MKRYKEIQPIWENDQVVKVKADGEVLFKSPTYEEDRIVIVFKMNCYLRVRKGIDMRKREKEKKKDRFVVL